MLKRDPDPNWKGEVPPLLARNRETLLRIFLGLHSGPFNPEAMKLEVVADEVVADAVQRYFKLVFAGKRQPEQTHGIFKDREFAFSWDFRYTSRGFPAMTVRDVEHFLVMTNLDLDSPEARAMQILAYLTEQGVLGVDTDQGEELFFFRQQDPRASSPLALQQHDSGRFNGKEILREQPFIANDFQKKILGALDRKALRTDELADKTIPSGGDRSRLFKKNGALPELKRLGKVAHHPRVGYYRPDAPPPELPELNR